MKELRKILKKAGPVGLIILAALAIFLLMQSQPKVSGGRAQAMPSVKQQPDAALELVDMRAPAFVQLLQRVQAKNAGTFSFNAADTSGKQISINTTDEAMRNSMFFDDRPVSAQQMALFKSNGIGINSSSIQLPVKRKDGVLVVRVPSVIAYALAK